jgi:hypothetical protein
LPFSFITACHNRLDYQRPTGAYAEIENDCNTGYGGAGTNVFKEYFASRTGLRRNPPKRLKIRDISLLNALDVGMRVKERRISVG